MPGGIFFDESGCGGRGGGRRSLIAGSWRGRLLPEN